MLGIHLHTLLSSRSNEECNYFSILPCPSKSYVQISIKQSVNYFSTGTSYRIGTARTKKRQLVVTEVI